MNKILVIFLLIVSLAHSQDKSTAHNRNFEVFVFYDRYGEQAIKYFDDNNFKASYLITRSMIDPNKSGQVDFKHLNKRIDKLIPNKKSNEAILIDWEEPFQVMKEVYEDQEKFKLLSDQYIALVKFLRNLRPNAKVAIYGIPFVAYKVKWPPMQVNEDKRFDPILSEVDFISPGIYPRHRDEDVGLKSNQTYIKSNLEVSFKYAERLNKPVVPFIWPYYHPSNKKYAYKSLTISEVQNYLDSFFDYEYKEGGSKISGIIWFDNQFSTAQRKNYKEHQRTLKIRDSVLINSLNKYLTD